METLELSEILGAQVECNACHNARLFRFPLKHPNPIGAYRCECSPLAQDNGWMEEVARMTEAIETVRAGEKGRPQPRFKLSFLLSDKP
jgi:hypothetical protein